MNNPIPILKTTLSTFLLTLALSIPFTAITTQAEPTTPIKLGLPTDFTIPKSLKKERTKIRALRVHLLEPQQGIHPMLVSGLKPHLCSEKVLTMNDVILAVDGTPLEKDPLAQFNATVEKALDGHGYVSLTRWRQGKIKTVRLDLGTKPQDLTQTPIVGRGHDWRLGPMGANGWVFCKLTKDGASRDSRQILITQVDKGGPSDGKLQLEDVITGAYGKPFTQDARRAIAAAINKAETTEQKGILSLQVWRSGKSQNIKVTLPVMGNYSATSPYDCPKTDKIINQTCDYLLTKPLSNHSKLNGTGHYREGFVGYLNALGLMATGREDVMPKVREFAYGICIPDENIPVKDPSLCHPGAVQSLQDHRSMVVWDWAYRSLVLSEYYLITKDPKVLPTIREYATKIAMGQSKVGSWGHTYAAIANTGYLNGHLGGYGAINMNTLNCGLALHLAQRCGIDNQAIKDAIVRTRNFFTFYIGKGALPYGDHAPGYHSYSGNGKSAGAAVYFDIAGNEEGARFFNAMAMGHTVSGREEGHGGHFFSHKWGGIGAARGGKLVLHNFFEEMNFLFTLERQPDGRMVNQKEAGEYNDIGDLKIFQEFSGIRLLQLCAPRKVLYLTGKGTPEREWLTQKRIDEVFAAGRLLFDKEARGKLSKEQILTLLQDELPATRALAIKTITERQLNLVPDLLKLLESKSKFARAGAAQAIGTNGYGSKEAVAKLIHIVENDTDLLCRIHAVRAFTASELESGILAVSEPAIPSLLKLATQRWESDPNQKLQVEIAIALFNTAKHIGKPGLCVKYGMSDANRPLFAPALKVLLLNPNGSARGWASGWSFKQLTQKEIEFLWLEIYLSSRYKGPSSMMWSNTVRIGGLTIMSKRRIAEGLDILVELMVSPASNPKLRELPLKLVPMYGSHAKRYLPALKKGADEFSSAKKHKIKKKADPINKLIKIIEAMPDKPPFELISIAEYIKGAEDPYKPK
ncbi:MAG: DUF6288 domain-containing protein [Akkermansiaceae bacterium]